MPIEVIDLLSSPNITPSNPPPRTTINATQRTQQAAISVPKPKSYARFLDIDDLSDDGLPPLPTLRSELPSAISKQVTAGPSTKATSDFLFLSDDFDSTIDLSQSYDLPPPSSTNNATTVTGSARREPLVVAGVSSLPAKRVAQNGIVRSASSVESRNGVNGGAAKTAGIKRAKTTVGVPNDPIFTSSMDVVDQLRETAARRMRGHGAGSDPVASSPVGARDMRVSGGLKTGMGRGTEQRRIADDISSDPFASSPVAEKRSAPTADYVYGKGKGKGKEASTTMDLTADSSDLDLPDFNTIASTQSQLPRKRVEPMKRTASASGSVMKDYQADKKKRDKEFERAEKAAEKEAEKERKRIAKEEKAREKARELQLSKVNTLKTDKKVSTSEMIVDLPIGLETKLSNQVRGFLEALNVQVTEWDSKVRNVVKWRRKVIAKYNEAKGHWEPCVPHIRVEEHVLVVISAQEFVDMAAADEGNDLDAHALRMKAQFGDHIIYLLEGLTPWMRKNRNIRNKKYTDAVRKTTEAESSQAKGKGKKTVEYVDEDSIEDALLKLQVLNGVLIHHTNALVETAEWIVAFTQHISTIPYRKEKMVLDTNFCMETGQVKTGEDAFDTYIKMLQEIVRITGPIAYGIAAEYPNVQSLVKGLREKGPECLKNCRKAMNKDGGFSDRDIGVAVSKRVHKIFLGRDVASEDV